MQSEFDTVRKGYRKEQVDAYINYLETIIDEYVQKEKAAENLVALTEQQTYALIQESEVQAAQIIQQAEQDADDIVSSAYAKLHSIQQTIREQNVLLDDFRKDYNRFILKYVNEVNKNSFLNLKKAVNDIDNYIEDTIKSAEKARNGYFVPNPSLSPIIIVEPDLEDNIFDLNTPFDSALEDMENPQANTESNIEETDTQDDKLVVQTDEPNTQEEISQALQTSEVEVMVDTVDNTEETISFVKKEEELTADEEEELLNNSIQDNLMSLLATENTVELKEIQDAILALETEDNTDGNLL